MHIQFLLKELNIERDSFEYCFDQGRRKHLRRQWQLPEKGTFSMTDIRIIAKKASLTFPILFLGGGTLICLKVRERASF